MLQLRIDWISGPMNPQGAVSISSGRPRKSGSTFSSPSVTTSPLPGSRTASSPGCAARSRASSAASGARPSSVSRSR